MNLFKVVTEHGPLGLHHRACISLCIAGNAPSTKASMSFAHLRGVNHHIFRMGITLNALTSRLAALELQVGIGKQWQKSDQAQASQDKSMVHELASLQAKVDRIFTDNPELRALPDIIKEYGREPAADSSPSRAKHLQSMALDTGVQLPDESVQGSVPETSVTSENSTAEKQEQILISYPAIMECYNLLLEFLLMDIPDFSIELSEKLSMSQLESKRAQCESISRQFHLLIVKNIVLLENFTAMVKHQIVWSRNIEKRMRVLASKISSVERDHHRDTLY